MYIISIETGFKAEHQLKFKGAGREELHVHDWKVKVAAECAELDENGLGVDFNFLKAKTNEILAEIECRNLEKLPVFSQINASAENVAKYIYEKLEQGIGENIQLKYVEVTEESGCKVRYFVDNRSS